MHIISTINTRISSAWLCSNYFCIYERVCIVSICICICLSIYMYACIGYKIVSPLSSIRNVLQFVLVWLLCVCVSLIVLVNNNILSSNVKRREISISYSEYFSLFQQSFSPIQKSFGLVFIFLFFLYVVTQSIKIIITNLQSYIMYNKYNTII